MNESGASLQFMLSLNEGLRHKKKIILESYSDLMWMIMHLNYCV